MIQKAREQCNLGSVRQELQLLREGSKHATSGAACQLELPRRQTGRRCTLRDSSVVVVWEGIPSARPRSGMAGRAGGAGLCSCGRQRR